VANARHLRCIYQNQRKSDAVDARTLARVGRLDPALLCPIRHRGEEGQRDLTLLRARGAMVSARTDLVNAMRGLVKSMGGRLRKIDVKSLHHAFRDEIPGALQEALTPILLAIEFLNEEIGSYDRRIDALAAEKYPETGALSQVVGVGNLTALAYVLTLEEPGRFARSRDAGAFLGLTPKRDQSGEVDKQLRISKAGDRLVRTLLVQCAHYILGRNGPESDLKRYGERIACRGGPIAKRKAVVAVARKLAVLLHHLWKTGEVYDPNHNHRAA
jgi:transposase